MDDLSSELYRESEAIKSVGGQIRFTGGITFSSSHLINNYLNSYPEKVRNFLKNFREKYSADDVKKQINNLKSMKVLVIGDAVIDEYNFCRPLGKSGKENLVVMQYLDQESYAGGVLALANHVAGFCSDVHLVSLLGSEDSREDFINKNLKSNISKKFFYRDDAPTVLKKRFLDSAFLNKLFEIYHFEDSHLSLQISDQIKNYLKSIIHNYDLVIVLDYAHGFLNEELIEFISKEAKFLAVNTQTNSANYGFNLITKYPRADYVDRVGAGDAFLAVTSPCVASGMPLELVSFIGNLAGALKIQIVGNKSSIESDMLLRALSSMLK